MLLLHKASPKNDTNMADGKKVLIIDDETDLCLLLKGYFIRKGHEVFISHDLKSGLAKLNEVQPDILFIDNNLPDGAGWDKVPDIASAHPKTFICLVSAFHPSMPRMPADTKYTSIEKPISLSTLDQQFASF
jgi:DNA-binding NtrC family response regulator